MQLCQWKTYLLMQKLTFKFKIIINKYEKLDILVIYTVKSTLIKFVKIFLTS